MSDRDDFFVGYLATPVGARRFLWPVAVGLVVVGGAIAAGLAAMQRDPGDGVWDLERVTELAGVVYERPCPMVRVGDVSVLLVGEGKVGFAERVAGLEGKRVQVRGHTLTRAAVRMFEVEEGGMRVVEGDRLTPEHRAGERREVTLRGELVDSKCFAGAMKPGEGKTHKGCAVLCLRGGIPPVFVAAGEVHLVVDEATGASPVGPALDRLLPYVGDRVEVRGAVEGLGDVRVLRLSTDLVRRL